MEIMDLVRRDSLSLEYRKSSMGENRLVRLARCPILACHIAVVGGWGAPGEAVAFIICAHSVETIAPGELPLEMVDVGKLDIWRRRLIVIAILIEPRNGIRARTAVGGRVVLWNRRSASLRRGLRMKQSRRQRSRKQRTKAKFQQTAALYWWTQNAIFGLLVID